MRLPASAERDARAEGYVARIDALPDQVILRKIQAHGRMNSYYRAYDIDDGIIAHSTKLIEFGKKLKPEERINAVSTLTDAYINLAEALAGHGHTREALDVLRRVPDELNGIEWANGQVQPVLERYLLIGNPAAAPHKAATSRPSTSAWCRCIFRNRDVEPVS